MFRVLRAFSAATILLAGALAFAQEKGAPERTPGKQVKDLIKKQGCTIVHVDDMGLKQLAYAINKRNSGIYYTIEFACENGSTIAPVELALRRDERIMRYLTIALDKFGVKYNEDKRSGLIKKVQRLKKKAAKPADVAAIPAKVAEALPEVEELEITEDEL